MPRLLADTETRAFIHTFKSIGVAASPNCLSQLDTMVINGAELENWATYCTECVDFCLGCVTS